MICTKRPRRYMCVFLLLACAATAPPAMPNTMPGMREAFATPSIEYWPRTRWWWLGNALTPEEISWQLREMQAQGIGGVEQISMGAAYERGNVPYLSDEFFALLRHAAGEARSLGMTISLNFGGPGWIWGGDWIPVEQRNQSLLSSSVLTEGPGRQEVTLSTEATINPREPVRSHREIAEHDRLIAVVAGRIEDGVIDPESLRDVTGQVRGRTLVWTVPRGTWRIMAFWATLPEGGFAVNHIDKAAMQHYVSHLGEKYLDAVGDHFGTTIDSLFGDSFEVPVHRNGIYWADSLPTEFRQRKSYDLIPHLAALWWEVGEISPKVRYDVNEVLHQMGMEAFFEVFTEWCRAHGVESRVQPYGFVTDNLEGAGAVDVPEMEITAGEKDAVPWLDTRIGPREYVASGAHLYGRNIVSVEAYTYLHWEPYRATLEELKIASDTFLRAGANRFYNHGFTASPERDIAPSRGFFAAIHISPDNVWWRYYPHLSDYVARSCYLLQQGVPVADVAVYAPTANQWTLGAFNARRWTRDFDWGELGRLLLLNGYDFDLVNDDALQRLACFEDQTLRVGTQAYQVLILPNIQALPLESFRRIEQYIAQGGVVIALERVPEASCGMRDWTRADREVRELSARLFRKPTGRDGMGIEGPSSRVSHGAGTTYWVEQVLDRRNPLDQRASLFDPFLKVLRAHVSPDMQIDYVREHLRENPGLCFTHRRQAGRDVYFVTNIQEHPVDMPVGFRVTGAAPWEWNPSSGIVSAQHAYVERDGATWLPVRLAPYASTFFVFEQGEQRAHVRESSLRWIESVDRRGITGWTDRAGGHHVQVAPETHLRTTVRRVPAPVALSGPWRLVLESPAFERHETQLDALRSWTDLSAARHFSGTGVYTTEFTLPARYRGRDVRLFLDLGVVGNVAEVWLNGAAAGVVWMRGQRLEITGMARRGVNRLEVQVTNTLINRVSGLEELPPVPTALQDRLGRGVQDEHSPAHTLLGFEPLPRSGLLGPVVIQPYTRVEIPLGRNH